MPCNKREPGSRCSAIDRFNPSVAILGASEHRIACHPSAMKVALTPRETSIVIQDATGEREVAIANVFLLASNTPQRETASQSGGRVTHRLPASPPCVWTAR